MITYSRGPKLFTVHLLWNAFQQVSLNTAKKSLLSLSLFWSKPKTLIMIIASMFTAYSVVFTLCGKMKGFSFYNSSCRLRQNAVEKQKEFVAKLQELCDDLTQTENRLIGHQQQSTSAKSVGDVQQYQQENQV